MTVPIKVVPDFEVKKWTDLGWVFSAPAFVKGHSVLAWLGDDKPREPEE